MVEGRRLSFPVKSEPIWEGVKAGFEATGESNKTVMRALFLLLALITAIGYFWHSAVMLPLKWLVVFLHESSHAVATIITGGTVKSLVIVPEQGGQVISVGGNRFVILSAGYVGSLLCGLFLFLATVYTERDRLLTAALGVMVIVITISFAKTVFSLMFGIAAGGALCLSARYLPDIVNDLICRVIALSNILYVPLDIYDDTLARQHLRSDAAMLAEEFGGHTMIWGGLWLVICLVLIIVCFRLALRMEMGRVKDFSR